MRVLVVLSLLFTAWCPAWAALVRPLTLEELAASAERILVGRVISKESRFEGGRIVTRVKLAPAQTLKGPEEAEVEVQILGGEVDGIAQRVSGMPAFTLDEQVVVFLTPTTGRSGLTVVGLAQGKLTVTPRLDGVKVVRRLDGLGFVTPEGVTPLAERLKSEETLDAFLGQLTTALTAETLQEDSDPTLEETP